MPESPTSPQVVLLDKDSAEAPALPPMEELLKLLFREIRKSRDPRLTADLKVRAALLLWDGRGQSDPALELLSGVDHPVATALRFHSAIEASDADQNRALLQYAEEAQRRGDSDEMAEVGVLLLLRGEHARAAALLERSGETSRAVRALALSLAGRFGEVVEVLSTSTETGALLLAAHLCEDRLSDGERARTLLRRVLDRAGVGISEQVRALERLLDLEWRRAGEAARIELYRRKLDLLGGLSAIQRALEAPGQGHAKLFGTALLLGQALERGGALPEAAFLLTAVGHYSEGCPEGATLLMQHLLLRARARVEAARGNRREAAALFQELGQRLHALAQEDPQQPALAALAAAYRRRAAEIWDTAREPAEAAAAARALYEEMYERGPEEGGLLLCLLRILLAQGEHEAAEAALLRHDAKAHPELAHLCRAAAALRGTAAPDEADPGDRLALEALCRTLRRRADRPHLIATYRRLAALPAENEREARRAAAYLQVAGALALEALPAREAEAILDEALAGGQDGPQGKLLPHLCRVLLLRRLPRPADLCAAIQVLLPHTTDLNTQAELYRQLARAAQRLDDAELARRSYQQALEVRPGDVAALHALARLCRDTEPARAALLLRQAVEGARHQGGSAPVLLPGLLCELAGLYERDGETRDEAQAIACYKEALRLDPRSQQAAQALVNLYRSSRQTGDLLPALERAAALCADEKERLRLLLELGRCAEAQAGTDGSGPPDAPAGAFATSCAEQAMAAYAQVLGLDPQNETALERLEHLCRRLEGWPLLLSVLEPSPPTPRTLRVLCEACERLERWADLARYREQELALLTEPREGLRAARSLAELYEHRLGQPEAAARVWERAYQIEPDTALSLAAVPAALERLYEETGRWADLAGLLQRELAQLDEPPAEEAELPSWRERRRRLLLRLGEVLKDHLHEPERAAQVLERVLGEWPEDPSALSALSALYAAFERPEELRRVLEARARATPDPGERAKVLVQRGEVSEKAGDLDGAERAFAEAFALEPGSRAAFTALERIYYRRERWAEAMAMYDTAVSLVKEQKSRAYRIGDLYARKGQVLLQYLQRPEEAAANYMKALEADPDNDANQAALERVHVAAGDFPALIACYERRAQLVRDDGKRVEILRRAARVAAAKLRDVAEAIRLYQKLHAVDPTDGEALDALERHYERNKDWEGLLSILGTRLALSQVEADSISLCLRMAHIAEDGLRDLERTIEFYRQALEHQPNHREALDALARLYEGSERWAELVEVSRRQIRLTTDRTQKALLYFKCGSVMEAKFAKEDDAIRYYEAAVKTSPSCLPALHGLRDLFLRRQDWPRVTQTLELEAKLWTEDKERAGIYAHIGQIYREKLGDLDRAIQYYESALAVDKECLPANRALFEVYYERGDFGRAVPMSQVLAIKANREGDPAERSEFYRKRAIVAEHTGDLRAAAESLVVALETQPENLEALELLVGLCRRDAAIYDFTTTFRELEKLYRRRNVQKGLGLTLVARSVLAERAYEIETAEELLTEAVRLSPGDYAVTEALAGLNERLRRFGPARAVLLDFIAQKEQGEPTLQSVIDFARAHLRLAEMYSEAAMEPEHAAATLREVVRRFPDGGEGPAPPPDLMRVARFRLVQELYLLGRYPDARAELDTLIDLAVQPQPDGTGSMAPPEELARYYDYLARLYEAQGDGAAAQRTYRRAVDLDPAHALSVLALARRAAASGDLAQAELLIRDAVAQAIQRGDGREELRLRRGAARILATYDALQASEAYRQVIQLATSQLHPEDVQAATADPDVRGAPGEVVARETLDDRVALADLLLQAGQVGPAQEELHRVLQRDLRHAPAYRLLQQVFARLGEGERAGRVQAALSLLGYAEPVLQAELRTGYRPTVRRGTLPDDVRQQHLLLPAMRTPYLELLQALAEPLSAIFPPPWPPPHGGESVPAIKVADASFKVCMADVLRLCGLEGGPTEVLVARGVPGGVLALEAHGGRPQAVLWEATLLDRPEGERRFLLARACEALRGGYAVALRLRPAELREVGKLLYQLLRPEAERDAATQEFHAALPRRTQKAIERFVGADAAPEMKPEARPEARPEAKIDSRVPVEAFLAALPLCADRGGLLACDDIAGAIRSLARLQGEELAVVDGAAGGVLLGQVAGGAALVRFFLSENYHLLRAALM